MPARIGSLPAVPAIPRRDMTRAAVGPVVVAGFALSGVVVDVQAASWQSALDIATGVAVAAAGWVLKFSRPSPRAGNLFLTASAAWFAGTALPGLGPSGAAAGAVALTLHRGPFVHGILAVPGRRSRSRLIRLAVASSWISGAIPPLARFDPATVVLGVVIALAGVGGLRQRRREPIAGIVCACAGAYGAALGFPAALRVAGIGQDHAALVVYMGAVMVISLVLALGALTVREYAVATLAIDLGDRPDGATLRRSLARAFGDPELSVAIWLADERRYVDEFGTTVSLSGTQAQTPLFLGARRVGVVLHAPSTLLDARIAEEVAAVAALAMDGARIQADAARGLEELTNARRRIVEQAHQQRQLIAADIRRGADRHLEAAQHLLREVAAASGERVLLQELSAARAAILSLATGLDPGVPPELRLRDAAERRTARSPVPVQLEFEAIELPEHWQHALVLVFAEAVTNAVKHAQCRRIDARLRVVGQHVLMEIVDDGVGGADAAGFGLRGLSDRVTALGGSLEVITPPGVGTTILARLPWTVRQIREPAR